MKIVFFKGNDDYGIDLNNELTKQLIKLIPSLEVYESITDIPPVKKSDIFIGFSRGSRYLKKLYETNNDSLFISIGGIGSKNIITLYNKDDRVRFYDFSKESINAHFFITNKMKETIIKKINQYKKDKKMNNISYNMLINQSQIKTSNSKE